MTTPDARSADMKHQYEQGYTLLQIGEEYGITRERVRQILKQTYNMCGKDGGPALLSRLRRNDFNEKREVRMQNKWGCSYAEYRKILKRPDNPTEIFRQCRINAITMGHPWKLTLWQWWKIWKDSGNWPKRGRGFGFQMCRLDKSGPYSVDNVCISSGPDNMTTFWSSDDPRAKEIRSLWHNYRQRFPK